MMEPGPILVVIERLQTRMLHLEALLAERDAVIAERDRQIQALTADDERRADDPVQ